MIMRQVADILIGSGETIELEPGGDHVMLFGTTEGVEEGNAIMLTLQFETAGEIEIEVPVGVPAWRNDPICVLLSTEPAS